MRYASHLQIASQINWGEDYKNSLSPKTMTIGKFEPLGLVGFLVLFEVRFGLLARRRFFPRVWCLETLGAQTLNGVTKISQRWFDVLFYEDDRVNSQALTRRTHRRLFAKFLNVFSQKPGAFPKLNNLMVWFLGLCCLACWRLRSETWVRTRIVSLVKLADKIISLKTKMRW